VYSRSRVYIRGVGQILVSDDLISHLEAGRLMIEAAKSPILSANSLIENFRVRAFLTWSYQVFDVLGEQSLMSLASLPSGEATSSLMPL
jgi:hypothetical protein